MGDHEELRGTSGRATWRNQERGTLSKTKIKAFYPSVDLDKCTLKTQTRVFTINGMEA